MTRWYEFNEKMKNQHRRIIDAVGEDAFMAESINRFPLVLDDNAMYAVATPLGWQQSWVSRAKAAPKAPPGRPGEIAAVLAKAGPAPAAVAPPPPRVAPSGASSDATRAPLPTPARTLIPPPVVKPPPMTAPPRVVSHGGPAPAAACKNQFVSQTVFPH